MSQSDSAARGDGAARGSGAGAKRNLLFWLTPATAALGGVVYLIVSSVGGHPLLGVALLGMMLVFAAGLVLAAQHSETVRGLMDRKDERLTTIDLRATAFTGLMLILAILVAAFVELGRGHSGAPYTWLAAIAGVSYVVAVAVLRFRQ